MTRLTLFTYLQTSGSLTGDQSTNLFVHPVAGDMPSEPTKVQTTGKEKSEISSGDVPSKVEMSTTNNAAPTGNEVMGKSQNKIDIAQMYVSPKCSTVYESFHSVMEFMDNCKSSSYPLSHTGSFRFYFEHILTKLLFFQTRRGCQPCIRKGRSPISAFKSLRSPIKIFKISCYTYICVRES